MDTKDNVIINDIVRHRQEPERFCVIFRTACTSTIYVDHKIPLQVLTSCRTNGINKTLCIVINRTIGTIATRLFLPKIRRTPGAVNVRHFIITLKNKALIIILEFIGYLHPKKFKRLLVFLIVILISTDMSPLLTIIPLPIFRFMMGIQDAIHALTNYIIHHLMNPFHPFLVYHTIVSYVGKPGYGNQSCGLVSSADLPV